jgi:hypothetical protein
MTTNNEIITDSSVPIEEPIVPLESPILVTEEPIVPVEEPIVPVEETIVPVEETIVPVEEPIEIEQIKPRDIIIIPPTAQKTANVFWLKQLIINAPSLKDKAEVIAKLVPFSSTTGEMFPDRTVTLVIDDVLSKAQVDSQLALTINSIFAEIDRQAKLQNLI